MTRRTLRKAAGIPLAVACDALAWLVVTPVWLVDRWAEHIDTALADRINDPEETS